MDKNDTHPDNQGNLRNNTIVAISTSLGIGAIAIVRISGIHALDIADQIYRGKQKPSTYPSHTVHIGYIETSQGMILDHVLLLIMKAPRTYTGEDIVEIHCHGGKIASQVILNEIVKHGARIAEPGEFTRRSFLHGRIDLIQAEAIGDLIHAKTELEGLLATKQLTGFLSNKIISLREKLINVAGQLELAIDFTEEDLIPFDNQEMIALVSQIKSQIQELIQSIDRGKVVKEGVKVIICGKENVGKSSIFNRLLNKNRAIVTEIPGTTRDVLEDSILLNGIIFRMFDTAGIRGNTEDIVEKEGIKRTWQMIDEAELILFILDISCEISQEEIKIYEQIKRKPHVVVYNKVDSSDHKLMKNKEIGDIFTKPFMISATAGTGFESLIQEMINISLGDVNFNNEALLGNIRQEHALKASLEFLSLTEQSLSTHMSPEFVSVDLQSAIRCLSEIIGEITSVDILHSIFSKFCIGK